jgi:hypothetical protein
MRSLLRAVVTDTSLSDGTFCKGLTLCTECLLRTFLQRIDLCCSEDCMGDGVEMGVIPFLFPSAGPPPVSMWSSIELAGRLDAIEVWGRAICVGRVVVDWLNAIDVWGRLEKDDGGRLPGPTLLAKLLFEALRDEMDAGRDDVEDAKEVFRAPTRDVPLTGGRGAAMDVGPGLAGSPARSTSVFLFGSDSFTRRMEAAGQPNVIVVAFY